MWKPKFDKEKEGLIPVVTICSKTGVVLMVASMNREAYEETIRTGKVVYYSRSRKELWYKGKGSGHEQEVVEIRTNCNEDSLQISVQQHGAACHDGYYSCYYRLVTDDGLKVVEERIFDPNQQAKGEN